MTDALSERITPAPLDGSKRTWLIATSCVGAAGVVGLVTPFVESLEPSEKAKAAGAPVKIDVSTVALGEIKTFAWRGLPIWVLHRTPTMLDSLKTDTAMLLDPDSKLTGLPTPKYAQNQWRSIKPEYLVLIAICTHLGCIPTPKLKAGPQPLLPDDWPGGFFCPCHGSMYDLAGRVFKDVPAPLNLQVPRYMFTSDTEIMVGEDKEGKA